MDEEQIRAIWPIGPITGRTTLVPLVVWRLETESGEFILKQRDEVSSSAAQKLAFEAELLTFLLDEGLPVTRPLACRSGELFSSQSGSYYALYSFVANQALPAPGPKRNKLFIIFGQTIANLHLALARFPFSQISTDIRRNDLTQEILMRGVVAIKQFLIGEDAERFATIHSRLEGTLADIYSSLPEQLIHRDCHRGNFLHRDGQVVAIIDWDQLSLGPPLLDLAYFGVQLMKRWVGDSGRMRQWLTDWQFLVAGYKSTRPLSELEWRALPYMLLTIPLLFAAWCLNTNQPQYVEMELNAFYWLHDQDWSNLRPKNIHSKP